MESIHFPEVNNIIAETQEDYQDLPAHVTEDGRVTVCFELNEAEKKQVVETGQIWLQFLNGKRPLAPISPSLLDPRISKETALNSDNAYGIGGKKQDTLENE